MVGTKPLRLEKVWKHPVDKLSKGSSFPGEICNEIIIEINNGLEPSMLLAFSVR